MAKAKSSSGAGMSTGTLQSFRTAAKRIARAGQTLRKDLMPKFLFMAGEEIMTDVKDARPGKGVPVDQGTLRGSGAVTALRSGSKPSVELSFGGAAAPYALIQHEVTSFKHTVGESRYLVRGLERWRASASAAFRALQQESKRTLGGA